MEVIRPLEGLTVVELAAGVAASYAGRLLAVMGARVVKLEPAGGSELRRLPPPLADGIDESALFHYLNVDKLAATWEPLRDCARFAECIAQADVLIDDCPVSDRSAFGLDAPAVRKLNPGLVHVSVLPFGAFGEHCGYRGYEINLLHAGGEGYLMPNGLTLETFPEREPLKIHGHFAELVGGTSAVCGALAALLAPGGGGQYVDVSVQDANVAIGCFAVQRLGDGSMETRHNRSFKYGGVLQCADGYVELLTLEERQWQGLVELLGRPAWALAPELADALERGRRGPEINRELRAWARAQRVADLVRQGQELGVPLAAYCGPDEIVSSPQVQSRRLFASVPIAGWGAVDMLTAPFRFGEQSLAPRRAIGVAGADDECVWKARAASSGATR